MESGYKTGSAPREREREIDGVEGGQWWQCSGGGVGQRVAVDGGAVVAVVAVAV
jgi:hypothetical protein